ncbi:MAG: hypothetical protein C5B49_13410 [Bdellovibrio sp.]|nr:MAG: hypothetical protein C5B49_13410 [Bdellovibrio sp.]
MSLRSMVSLEPLMTPLKYFVFDLDGTLVDSFKLYFESIEKIFDEHGMELKAAHRDQLFHMPTPRFLSQWFPEERVRELVDELIVESRRRCFDAQPFDGVSTLLARLKQHGKSLAVWTNRDRGSTLEILRLHQMDSYFDLVVSGSCVEQHKPSPEGLRKILAHFQAAPQETVVIGDHDVDMVPSLAEGCHFVRASWHSHWREFKCEQSPVQFHSFCDFQQWAELRADVRSVDQ